MYRQGLKVIITSQNASFTRTHDFFLDSVYYPKSGETYLSSGDWLISLSTMVSSCIHLAIKDRIWFFLWPSNILSCIYYNLFIQSSTDNNLSWFYLSFCDFSCYKRGGGEDTDNSYSDSFSLAKFPGMEWLSHMVDVFANL